MQSIFTKIYEKNIWNNGSGNGSSVRYNNVYINMLNKFLKDNSIKSVLDIGCGDWQFSQYINWNGIDYNGVDIVQSVIDTNNERFAKENINFFQIDPLTNELPGNFDLVIIKDVLQHWSNETIVDFMDNLITQGHKNILIINTAWSHFTNNKNKGEKRCIKNRYHYAKLDANDFPLNKYDINVIGQYNFKQISLIKPLLPE